MAVRFFTRSFRDALKIIFRSPMYSLINILTIAAMLFVLSCVYAISANMNNVMKNVTSQLEITAFYEKGTGDTEIASFERELLAMDAVSDLHHISKEEGLEKLREEWGDEFSAVLDRYENGTNPLPEAVTIHVADAELLGDVLNKLKGSSIIDSYNDSSEVANLMVRTSKMLNIGGLVIVLVLLAVCALIISNIVRLTIMSKADELEIMHYVGSPEWYIRMPYIMQSFLLSVVGSGAAVVAVLKVYQLVADKLQGQELFKLSGILSYEYIRGIVIPGCLLIGCAFSVITARLAVRKYLKK